MDEFLDYLLAISLLYIAVFSIQHVIHMLSQFDSADVSPLLFRMLARYIQVIRCHSKFLILAGWLHLLPKLRRSHMIFLMRCDFRHIGCIFIFTFMRQHFTVFDIMPIDYCIWTLGIGCRYFLLKWRDSFFIFSSFHCIIRYNGFLYIVDVSLRHWDRHHAFSFLFLPPTPPHTYHHSYTFVQTEEVIKEEAYIF